MVLDSMVYLADDGASLLLLTAQPRLFFGLPRAQVPEYPA